jgi:hypothetical protein
MNRAEIENHLMPLWEDIRPERQFWNAKPLLAHYTSIAVLEQMLKSNEIWLSNPLFMNDHEEVRFGIENGIRAVMTSKELVLALGSQQRAIDFRTYLDRLLGDFYKDEIPDTYVFCWSRH